MANQPHYPDTGDDSGAGSDHGSATGTPRWVKVFVVVGVVGLFTAFVLMHTLGGGMGGH